MCILKGGEYVKDYMFMIQSYGGRGSNVGGILLSKEDLLDEKYMSSYVSKFDWDKGLRYAKPRGYFDDVRSMSLEEFESIFSKHDILKMTHLLTYDSSKGYTKTLFRKEVMLEWGTDVSGVANRKKITKLKAGHIYLDKDGKSYWLYMGDITLSIKAVNGSSGTYSGNCFVSIRDLSNGTSTFDSFIRRLAEKSGKELELFSKKCFLKGIKAVIKDVGECADFADIFEKCAEIDIPKRYYSPEMHISSSVVINNKDKEKKS